MMSRSMWMLSAFANWPAGGVWPCDGVRHSDSDSSMTSSSAIVREELSRSLLQGNDQREGYASEASRQGSAARHAEGKRSKDVARPRSRAEQPRQRKTRRAELPCMPCHAVRWMLCMTLQHQRLKTRATCQPCKANHPAPCICAWWCMHAAAGGYACVGAPTPPSMLRAERVASPPT